ncbi:MAG: division/cell wall cluster transcriptional repressor MraZ [Pseudooceanicola nanhaiensis]
MSRRFRGASTHKVDTKGRVSIPASFRRVLETSDPNWQPGQPPELVIVFGDPRKPYLECYTMAAIEEIDEKIARMPRGSRERKVLEHIFNANSFPTTVDDTGRLVLPAKLRERIDLDGEAYFIGMGDTFNIWKPETYETENNIEAYLNSLPEDKDPLEFLDRVPERSEV